MPAERSDVTDVEKHVRTKLPLDRQVCRHRVRRLVIGIHAPGPADRCVVGPIYVGIRIRRRHSVWRNVHGKLLNEVRSGERAYKWRRHHWRFRARVRKSVRWIARGIRDCQTLDGSEETSCSCPDAGFPGPPVSLPKNPSEKRGEYARPMRGEKLSSGEGAMAAGMRKPLGKGSPGTK